MFSARLEALVQIGFHVALMVEWLFSLPHTATTEQPAVDAVQANNFSQCIGLYPGFLQKLPTSPGFKWSPSTIHPVIGVSILALMVG